MVISILCCHPGYTFNNKTLLCEISNTSDIIVRAHPKGRYFYAQVNSLISYNQSFTDALFFRVNFMSRTGVKFWCQLLFHPHFRTAPGMDLDLAVWSNSTLPVSSVQMEGKVCTKIYTSILLSFQRNCHISVLYIGFLCGQCPEGEGVDFTLRQCRKCTIQDTIFVIAFCKINTCALK